jgi:midasin (ATPase involved in ribosome maturation)
MEGILLKAMKNGDWVIFDELNLAPGAVLEALNRVKNNILYPMAQYIFIYILAFG